MAVGSISVNSSTDGTRAALSGRLGVADVMQVNRALKGVPDDQTLVLDMAAAEWIDTSIAWAIGVKQQAIEAAGGRLQIDGALPEARQLLDTVFAALPKPDAAKADGGRPSLTQMLDRVGRSIAGAGGVLAQSLALLGMFLSRLGHSVLHPRDFRLTALVHHCQAAGLGAVPIVALMAFLIGVVLAFQGSMQLRQFGAEVFVVDLISISILRELGILLTAIIVAGRTASAFTAAIGSMKMREEIDAMRTLAIDPVAALIVPRVLALILMLPILGLIANLAGLIGGALMAWVELGISPAMFQTRLIEGTDVKHVFVGLVKAPVFALVIGIIGCQAGLRVKGTAESLGSMTSSSVVAAIFAVIVIDALFSIFFAQIGI
ncbi:ABC transporter permease [Pseudotabrizicola sp. L79]|uniref:ABC transporter permease n=1 Tax=Pseudotabrizicola sp. L79 TaxID=3118402 RepID=UPI002F9598A4